MSESFLAHRSGVGPTAGANVVYLGNLLGISIIVVAPGQHHPAMKKVESAGICATNLDNGHVVLEQKLVNQVLYVAP